MVLMNFVAFVISKILFNLVSMQSLLNANNRWHEQNLENCLTFLTLYLFSMYFYDQLLVLSNFWFPRL